MIERPADDAACELAPEGKRPGAAVIVVFGATGDLTRRKIVPALWDLHLDGGLPEDFAVLGFARRELSDAAFRDSLREACGEFARRKPAALAAEWASFESRVSYLRGEFDESAPYAVLRERWLEGTGRGALFYLACGPELFATVAKRLGEAGLGTAGLSPAQAAARPYRRLVVEKPFGADLSSAHELNAALRERFREADVFRIDHYLGKETVQNLLYLRFANAIFEPLWNRDHVERVEISVTETVGVGSRAGYYDKAGAARDMLQNHLMQLLCLVAMEPPANLDPESIRAEKVKVLKSIATPGPERLRARSVRGRYAAGQDSKGAPLAAYLDEERVAPDSRTETFAAVRLEIDNWRWSGVPFVLSTGKALSKRMSEVAVRFRRPPSALFAGACGERLPPNDLVLRVQPDEGLSVWFNAKRPGRATVAREELGFSWRSRSDYYPEAYERLLGDALAGDSTLFIRFDEAEEAWRIVDAFRAAWDSGPPEELVEYAAGSEGPSLAALAAPAAPPPRPAARNGRDVDGRGSKGFGAGGLPPEGRS